MLGGCSSTSPNKGHKSDEAAEKIADFIENLLASEDPDKSFRFDEWELSKRLEDWDDERELALSFSHWYASREYFAKIQLHTKYYPRKLRIKEVSFILDGKKYYLMKNKTRAIDKMFLSPNGFYHAGDFIGSPVAVIKIISIHSYIHSILKNYMDFGDEIIIPVTIIYSFDKKKERQQLTRYKVKCVEGRESYPWPFYWFMGLG
jgi:hypothetical protein